MTVLSILAVGLAGAAAVGANIGILDSASDGSISEDSGDVAPSTQVVDVYLPPTTGATADGAQRFLVDSAGTVALTTTAAGLALEEVVPTPDWSWTLVQSESTSLLVTFTDGTRTLEFTASTTGDGTISTFVSEPIAGSAPAVCDDDGDDDDGDDEDDVDEDDDDECEYEGSDDDD